MTQTHEAAVAGSARGSALARLKQGAKGLAHAALRPFVRALVAIGVGPDTVTVIGLTISLAAGLVFFEGAFRTGSLLLLAAGLCDVLDGEVARERGIHSPFGAFLDSTLDRIADGAVLLGIAGFYIANLVELAHSPTRVLEELSRGLEPRTWAVVALTAMVAAMGSFLVSYRRARAEGLGLDCRVGWFERPERMVLLMIAGGFGVGPVMPGALLLLAVLSFLTAAQRIRHVYKITRSGTPGAHQP
jgi:CDP-diacylglycerol--glycerol-3-phosphate 3-phosphatidyltransferase